MTAFKKLKNIFWRSAESKPEDISLEPTLNLEPLKISTPSLETPADVDTEFFGAIEQEIAKAMPIEFAEFYNQMSIINEKFSNLDEATRYQLAFHAARTALQTQKKNLTPARLLKSIGGMEELLEAERRTFQEQNEQGYQANLGAVKKKAEEMSRGIKDRENRLVALQKEIDAFLAAKSAEKKRLEEERARLISQRVVAEGEMNQLQQKKTERETQFSSALEAHRQRLEELKSKLEDHLKNI